MKLVNIYSFWIKMDTQKSISALGLTINLFYVWFTIYNCRCFISASFIFFVSRMPFPCQSYCIEVNFSRSLSIVLGCVHIYSSLFSVVFFPRRDIGRYREAYVPKFIRQMILILNIYNKIINCYFKIIYRNVC